ncbi:MAG: hypothetical protein SO434_06795 [Eubacteriales bacterium]|nr:hypothetical protein [Eubacteriales bacterium]
MRHSLEISCEKLKPIKIILLALCLVIDFGNLWIFLAGIATKNVWEIVESLGVFAILICVRIIACALTYKWQYDFDVEKVVISKIVWNKKRQKTTIEYAKIENVEKVDLNIEKTRKSSDVILLAPKNCNYEIYAITIGNKRYLIALDEYGYCMLKGKTYDIS